VVELNEQSAGASTVERGPDGELLQTTSRVYYPFTRSFGLCGKTFTEWQQRADGVEYEHPVCGVFDVGPGAPERTECADTTNGALDSGGDGCEYYELFPSSCFTGTYDDFDFTASDMCCACGGGDEVIIPAQSRVLESGKNNADSKYSTWDVDYDPDSGDYKLRIVNGRAVES
jgi:hypothetical protein